MNRFGWYVAPLALLLSGCVGYGYPLGDYPSGGYPGGDPGYYPGDGGYGSGRTFRCESNDGRTRQCATGGSRVRLVRQISDAPCVQGRSWGYGGNGIWVSNGCRAEFATTGGYYPGDGGPGYGSGGRFRCESRDNRTQYCGADVRGGVRLVRQLSDASCVQGRSWGYDSRGVWVSNGCRAEFESGRGGSGGGWEGGSGQTIRCESNDNRTRHCNARVVRGVRLVRQLSDTRCVQGQNWGWDASGVWVSRGCRAEFSVR